MKRVFLILFGIIICCFVSCKEVTKGKLETQDKEVIHEDKLIIEIEAVIIKDDSFELFYKRKDEQYNSQNKKEFIVTGSEDPQIIKFVLDDDVYPNNIRLDLGRNIDQGEILIKKLTFKYNDGEHVFTKEEFAKFFKPNMYLIFDFEKMVGKTKKIGDKYNPFFASYNISKFVNQLILY